MIDPVQHTLRVTQMYLNAKAEMNGYWCKGNIQILVNHQIKRYLQTHTHTHTLVDTISLTKIGTEE